MHAVQKMRIWTIATDTEQPGSYRFQERASILYVPPGPALWASEHVDRCEHTSNAMRG